ncbi:MAG: hypothetical protein N3A69_14260 [Leptospiraceae bacterium]|nr:hypothetical protein [Leptospiraceae bacterium]
MRTIIWVSIFGILAFGDCKKSKKFLPLLPIGNDGTVETPAYLPNANSGSAQGSVIPSPSEPDFPNPAFVVATGSNQTITLQWTNQTDATNVEICYNTTGVLSFSGWIQSNQLGLSSHNSLITRIEVYYSINGLNDSKRP